MQSSSSDRSSLAEVVSEHFSVLIQRLLTEVLGHQVRRVARPEHLGELDYPPELLFLEPQYSDVEMSNSPDALSLKDTECCGGVDMESNSQLDAEVIR